jgi:hypothetical protein
MRLYPIAAKTMTKTMTTTSHSTNTNSESRPMVMMLAVEAATTAWLSGSPEQPTQNEPAHSSPDVAAESQSRDPAPSTPAPVLPKCGSWCSGESILQTKCTMDPDIMPCEGVYCQTDCGLWNAFILKKRPKISCDQYKSGVAYPRGAVPCDSSCLPLELQKGRYPQPTGQGLLCKPGTCIPSAGMADLECPCNWFASTCVDSFVPVRQIRKATVGTASGQDGSSSAEQVVLELDSGKADEILKDYQPGSVMRIHHYGTDGVPREAVAAVVVQKPSPTNDDDGSSSTGRKEVALEILLGPTDASLHTEVAQVHDRLRELPSGAVENLYVSPVIGSFFNRSYTDFVSFLQSQTQATQPTDKVIVVSSGSALGAALGAVDAALDQNKHVQLFYGVRSKVDIPYKERLDALAKSKLVDLTIVLSTDVKGKNSSDDQEHKYGNLVEAIQRGEEIKLLQPSAELQPYCESTNKLYTQHVVGLSLFGDNTDSNSNILQGTGGLSSSVFVICGRSEVLLEMLDILHACVGNGKSSESFLKERIFTNV